MLSLPLSWMYVRSVIRFASLYLFPVANVRDVQIEKLVCV